jgi:iron complex outermembrane receptor protein
MANYYVRLLPPLTPPSPPGFPPLPFFPIHGLNGFFQEDTSYAVFTQGTYDLSSLVERLSVTAGYRYTWDERDMRATNLRDDSPFAPLTCSFPVPGMTVANCIQTWNAKFSSPTWTLSLDYKLNDATMLYLAHRHGYKAGGINGLALPAGFEPFQLYGPEKVDDAELGFKSEWSAGNVQGRFSAALYYSWVNDMQRTQTIPGQTTTLIGNAAKANVQGLEIQTTIIPLPGLDISLSYSYTDASYEKFIDPSTGIDFTSNAIPYTPEHRGSATVRYELPFTQLGRIAPSVTYSATSSYYYTDVSAVNFPGLPPVSGAKTESYGLVDARLDWSEVAGLPLDIAAFGRNLADKEYVQNGVSFAAATAGVYFGSYGEPRTYGVEAKYRF